VLDASPEILLQSCGQTEENVFSNGNINAHETSVGTPGPHVEGYMCTIHRMSGTCITATKFHYKTKDCVKK
jgi:hypothetical protein